MIVQWFGLSALDVVLCNWYPRTSLSLPYPHFPHFYYNLQLDLSYLWCPAFTFHVYCRILRYWPKHCPPTLTWLTWMSATTPSEMEASPSSLNTSRQESCTPIHMCTLRIRSTHTHTHTHTLQDPRCPLQSLNLSYNDFGPEGAETLTSALQVNTKLAYTQP